MNKKTLNICRICLQEIGEADQYYFLNNDNELKLQSKLLDFLPEIDLDIIPDPVTCIRCMVTIEELHDFKQLCLQTETTIKNLRWQIPGDSPLTFFIKKTVKVESLDNNIKVELSDLQIINDDCLEVNTDVPLCITEPLKTELYYCHHCDFNTNEKINLIGHFKIHENVKSFQCKKCSYSCVKKHLLKAHLRKHIVEKRYKCTECDYKTDRKCRFIHHGNMHVKYLMNVKAFKCEKGNFSTITEKNLRKHQVRIHNMQLEKYKCDQCEYASLDKYLLVVHMHSHRAKDRYKCSICDFSSKRARNLKRHERRHISEKPFKCNAFECNKCDYHDDPLTHLQSHNHTCEFSWKCLKCNYKTSDKSLLTLHVKTHTTEKSFKCNICDYCCSKPEYLNVHMRKHTGETPFKCNSCDYKTHDKKCLKGHKLQHAGEKPFKCNICNFCTNRKTSLKSHMCLHTGERPFKCSLCNSAFTQKSALSKHEKRHLGKSALNCGKCNFTTLTKFVLKQHLLKCDKS